VACNSSGALRTRFGTPRDYVIGLRLAHVDGSVSKSGGRVVKNVAGYDMNKLYVGSFGTLAVLTQVNLKLKPLPEADATVLVSGLELPSLCRLARNVLDSEDLQPASVFLLSGIGVDTTETARCLLIRLVDSDPAVRHQIERLKLLREGEDLAELSEGGACELWSRVADLDGFGSISLRLSLPLSGAWSMLSTCETVLPGSRIAVDLGAGVIRVAFDEAVDRAPAVINKVRGEAASIGGVLFVERAPLEVKRLVDAWGDPGSASLLMREIKEKFDPRSLLNPGRFVDGI